MSNEPEKTEEAVVCQSCGETITTYLMKFKSEARQYTGDLCPTCASLVLLGMEIAADEGWRMTGNEAWQLAREVVQQVANQQPETPDEGDPLTMDAETLARIVRELLETWGLVQEEE